VSTVVDMRTARVLLAAALAIAPGALASTAAGDGEGSPRAGPLPIERESPSLAGATSWLHSEPLTAAGLRGKVVLVEFGTYTCIYWRRTLPYVRAWADKYRDHGLVVIEVHTPEFEFERSLENVRRAAKDLNVDLPIAVDSDRRIWSAFDNRYWPALYFIDAQGRVRHHQFGEGGYEQSERVIQQLLAEADHHGFGSQLVSVVGRGGEAPADRETLRSPETYVGYGRGERFASPGGAARDERRVYAAPARLGPDAWALVGAWTIREPGAALDEPRGRIAYRFHARDLHLILAPPAPGRSVRFRVTIDGRPPGAAHGLDVDDQGNGTVTDPRMYQLIRQPTPIADRLFEIEFLDAGVEAFGFTFG
jgi:thiol-disulfide isomerase/thioredoxin